MKCKQTFYKTWEILKPFLFYYVLHNAVFILLLSLCRAAAEGLGRESLTYLSEHADTVTGIVSGVSMIISVLPLLPMLRLELAEHRASADGHGQGGLTVLLAVSSSLGLNVLLSLTGLVGTSAAYQEVADRQYGVAFGLGMLLYGLISPITEEIVFRGLVFNRMRRHMPRVAAVIASGVLFGAYHGNLVQGLYGGCMGILMAYLYERTHSFFTPCLFHAAANLAVYATAQNGAVQGRLFTIPGCAALFMISIICVAVTERRTV